MDAPLTTRFLNPFDASDRPDFERAWGEVSGDLPIDADPFKTDIGLVWSSEALYHARGGTPPVFALVEEGGVPLGLIPLRMMSDPKLGGRFIAIHQHPTRLSEASAVVRRGQLEKVVETMLRDARRHWKGMSGVFLEGLDSSGPLYSALVEAVGPFRLLSRPPKKQYYIDMSEYKTVDDHARSKSRNYRKNLSRGQKRLTEEGGYEYRCAAPSELNTFAQMGEIDQRTWRGREKEGDLPQTLLKFCHALQTNMREGANGRIEAIEFKGQPVAMLYSISLGNRCYAIKHTFDPEFGSYQPVMVLMQHSLERAIGEGTRYFEMLTGSTYAKTWADHEHDLSQDVVYFGSPLGYASLALVRTLRALKRLKDARQEKKSEEVQT